jgi:hypothetical protein
MEKGDCPESLHANGSRERGPDEALKLQFEAVSSFDPESKKVVQQVLDSMILQQEARRWSAER